MMRRVYLIRHGEPDFPGGKRMCLGRTDLPLSPVGRMRAAMAGAYLRDAGISAVFSSPLRRAAGTAAHIGAPVSTDAGFAEADYGVWDGLTFEEIRRDYPALYARRGDDPSILPPGAESFASRAARFSDALSRALAASGGDIAVVTHASITKSFLGKVLGLPPARSAALELPYGGVTALECGERLSVVSVGAAPRPALDEALCAEFWDCAELPENIRAHCAAVAALAGELCLALNAAGRPLDAELTRSCALLHDIARPYPEHASVGGAWLEALGYPREGAIVRRHMTLCFDGAVDEAAVVFIADKLLRGDTRTSIAGRYEASRKKCLTPEALAAHAARLREALAVRDAINDICGKEVIQ